MIRKRKSLVTTNKRILSLISNLLLSQDILQIKVRSTQDQKRHHNNIEDDKTFKNDNNECVKEH